MKIDDIFSPQEIETIADRAVDGGARVLNHRLTNFSENRLGYLGTHTNLELTLQRDNESDERVQVRRRFFVKSMPQLTEEQLMKIRDSHVFAKEAAYFNEILPILKSCCPATEAWCPECMLASDKVIVLEDMRERRFAVSRTKLLSEDQLRAALRAQARLHATSLVAERQLGKPLNEHLPMIRKELLFSRRMIKYKRVDLELELAGLIAERLGSRRDDARRLGASLRRGFYQMYDQTTLATRLPKVLQHGDAWPNNYLFDESARPTRCVLVDFQLIRYGPPMYDVILLAYLGSNRRFREKVMRRALVDYHEQLCEVLDKNDPEMRKPTLQDVLDEYEELRVTALFCSVMYYPMIWAGKATLEKYSEEELYARIMFRVENDFVMQLYDEDDEFAARINEIIEEALEYLIKPGSSIETRNESRANVLSSL